MKNIIVLGAWLSMMFAHTADAKPKAKVKDTSSYDIVAEYVRSLGAVHNIQQLSTMEQLEAEGDNIKTNMNTIKSLTRLKLEYNFSINKLKGMHLKRKQFDSLIPDTIHWYKKKLMLYDEMTNISKKIIDVRPNPKVDYSKLAARVPEISALLDYIDETIFQSMVLVFALLIDEKPDSEGHMSHLNISNAQKQKLLDGIDTAFGESLESENKNWTTSAAALLKAYLQKDYLPTDEWQSSN